MNLDLPDAQIAAIVGSAAKNSTISNDGTDEITKTLMLKRQRNFDSEGAEAEWRVTDSILVLTT